MAPNKSVAWEFFVKNNENKVKCKFCSSEYKYTGNTTTLINHVKKKHLVQYSEAIGQNLPCNRIENSVPEQSSTTQLAQNDLNLLQ
ncbi:unnamed protein product [Euphydryas editha]|uniref:BED-type domain-containing protein n=1 Tax=Euphydryas editha TaxID=104508 RepID=A0AAU9TMX5_EUPED|nr:unnamed protein product [Euphydryas editha]